MANQFPHDLKYSDSHEYVRVEGSEATMGVTNFAAEQLGDVVFVELPSVGQRVEAGESVGSIESVKAVSELYAMVSGDVVAINNEVDSSPELVNEDPYGDGWLVKIRMSDPQELDRAMTADTYSSLVSGQE
ncbi:MAG: glycine cleavage system protein GcvH [Limnothrix sp. BL-A-16]